ncbi:MAG: DUF393 domain-containing protein [Xanthomonadaceae bacterium]|nr:DUF393 domain-containing protein [Xanthomonadaceae bacterium]
MDEIRVYYDGDCPFCTRYTTYLNLGRQARITLTNLREAPETAALFEHKGLHPDKGMIVDLDGRLYGGADAMHVLSLLDQSDSVAARLTGWVFSKPWRARLLYPLLRLGRNTTLLLLGRQPLRSDPGIEPLRILFTSALGLFAWLHFLVYAFQFNAPLYTTTFSIGFAGLILILRPQSRRVLLLLLGLLVVDAWLQMPSHSNHTIIKNFLLLAALPAGAWHALRGNSINAFLDSLFGVGRWLLLLMYVFGVFHKINSDFLDPAVSCATMLWYDMPAWLGWIDAEFVGPLITWGTLFVETTILVMLIVPRLRYHGILIGIGFHSVLALSGYALYATFSMLSLMLHLTFLSSTSAQQIIQSPGWKRWQMLCRHWHGTAIVGLCATVLGFLSWIGSFSQVGLFWLLIVAPFFFFLAAHGRDLQPPPAIELLRVKPGWLVLVIALFFFNCITPYLGLKTAQSINMFANLRLEAHHSNHFLIDKPGPFHYLDDVVQIVSASGSTKLQYVLAQDLSMVYYDLLNTLDSNPQARVTYIRNGNIHEDQTRQSLAGDIEEILHPEWFRKWFHFNVVDLNDPKPCALDR